jgi:hypothetical protein
VYRMTYSGHQNAPTILFTRNFHILLVVWQFRFLPPDMSEGNKLPPKQWQGTFLRPYKIRAVCQLSGAGCLVYGRNSKWVRNMANTHEFRLSAAYVNPSAIQACSRGICKGVRSSDCSLNSLPLGPNLVCFSVLSKTVLPIPDTHSAPCRPYKSFRPRHYRLHPPDKTSALCSE